MLRELLQILNKEGAPSLVAALGQVKDVRALGKNVEIIVDDETSVEMIIENRHKHLIDEYMQNKGLICSFVSKKNATPGFQRVSDLSSYLG